MNITIDRPFAATDKGRRNNNEDSLSPLSEVANPEHRLFMVCDGVGGAEKGEVASALACDSFRTFFDTFLDGNDPSEEFVNKAVRYTESRMDEYVSRYPEAKGMATTLTLLYIGTSGIVVAHIGDSRVYQFRDGQIIYETEDHSYVQTLVRIGRISKEEAASHPQKNIITKALTGTSDSVSADVAVIKDIQDGDFFFLCTDGVTDCFPNEKLASLFSPGRSAETIKNKLIEHCSKESKDNYSFYIIPVLSNQKISGYRQYLLSFFYSFV